MKKPLSRRKFMQVGIQGGMGTLFFPLVAKASLAEHWLNPGDMSLRGLSDSAASDPHFFIQIVVSGGLDCSYFFDARPLEMTQEKKIQNYVGKEPTLWKGSNGTECWASPLVDPLLPLKNDFSIINGVLMETGFDGHGQNMNFFLAGNPFGGEYFVPHFNNGSNPNRPQTPLDAFQKGSLSTDLTNTGSVVPLSTDAADRLIARLKAAAPLDPSQSLFNFIRERTVANSGGAGLFSLGSKRMTIGMDSSVTLSNLFQQLKIIKNPKAVEDEQFLRMVLDLFKINATSSAILNLSVAQNVDVHDSEGAKKLPILAADIVKKLKLIFQILKDTPFSATQSFYDVTTLMFCSEFARTMRQEYATIDNTGTDHNNLNNSVLIAGKGIKGGLVLGASDFRTSKEVLSKAHSKMDPDGIKIMGRPFDFTAATPRTDLPSDFSPKDYLSISSVINTLYSLYGIKGYERVIERNGPISPILKSLLI